MTSCSNIFKNSKGSIHDRGGYRDWYEEWYNLLEVGDVIGVVYNDNTAHTMIVTCKDSSYVDYDKKEVTDMVSYFGFDLQENQKDNNSKTM